MGAQKIVSLYKSLKRVPKSILFFRKSVVSRLQNHIQRK